MQNSRTSQQQKIWDIYERIQILGKGSFGSVFLVRQIESDKLWALKQIYIGDMCEQEQLNAQKQVKILQALSHPNIIKLRQVHVTSLSKLNIVLEYANAGDLSFKIDEAKHKGYHFEQNIILEWFIQICLGLKHMHDRKVIHRDLKSANIFLTDENCIKIGDLGVSKLLEKTLQKAYTQVGSPYYLSPEIIQNHPYSYKTDIWSLGVLLYQLCTLQLPFKANSLQLLALKIVQGFYPQIPSKYSIDIKNLIKKMLSTKISERPSINQILNIDFISRKIKKSWNIARKSQQRMSQQQFKQNLQDITLKSPPKLIDIQKNMVVQNQSDTNIQNYSLQVNLDKQKAKKPTKAVKGGNKLHFDNPTLIKKAKHNPNETTLSGIMQIKPSVLVAKRIEVYTPLPHRKVKAVKPKEIVELPFMNKIDKVNRKYSQNYAQGTKKLSKQNEAKLLEKNNTRYNPSLRYEDKNKIKSKSKKKTRKTSKNKELKQAVSEQQKKNINKKSAKRISNNHHKKIKSPPKAKSRQKKQKQNERYHEQKSLEQKKIVNYNQSAHQEISEKNRNSVINENQDHKIALQLSDSKIHVISKIGENRKQVASDMEIFGEVLKQQEQIQFQHSRDLQKRSQLEQYHKQLNTASLISRGEMQTMKIYLQGLLGQDNLIYVYRFIENEISQQGKDLNYHKIIEQIKKKRPQIKFKILEECYPEIMKLILREDQMLK